MTAKRFVFAIVAGLLLSLTSVAVAADAGSPIRQVTLKGSINPVSADYLTGQIEAANAAGDRAVLLLLDTPGGLVTSMREVVQAMLASQVPIIVYVYPPGAGAASAGAVITLAADFAMMAPGTNIGAASPVSIGLGGAKMDETMKKKVTNDFISYVQSIAQQRGRNLQWAKEIVRDARSSTATEALKLKVIDGIADSVPALLSQLDGQRYLRHGKELRLKTAGAPLLKVEMSWRQSLFHALANPTVTYLLLMLGILGIFFEISQPGVILPGAIGAIAILLALFGLQMLPVNIIGVLLILLAAVLFILEVTVTSHGMLSVGGVISLALGSLLLIDSEAAWLQISRAVIASTVGVAGAFVLLVVYAVTRSQQRTSVAGEEAMAGQRGRAVSALDPAGRVFIAGEYWDARSTEPVPPEAEVEVVRVGRDLTLEVRPVKSESELDSTGG